MKRTRREFLLSSTAVGALLSGRAEARSMDHGASRAGGAGAGPPPQVIASLTVAGSSSSATFTSATANAFVGTVVAMLSNGNSPPFSGTISLDGGGHNTEGFHLSGSTSGSNLLAPAGGLSPGTYTDVIIRAQQAGLSDLTINPSLVASGGGPGFSQGVSFRATSGFVTDPPNVYGETATHVNYPVSAQNTTVGYEIITNTSGFTTEDHSNNIQVDPRLAGGASPYFGESSFTYRIDLPAPGLYYVRLAVGAPFTNTAGNNLRILDGTTLLTTITGDTTEGGWIDANNGNHSNALFGTAQQSWTGASTPGQPGYKPFTFATSILRVSSDISGLSHIFVSNVAPPSIPQVQTTPFPPLADGNVSHSTMQGYMGTHPGTIPYTGNGVYPPLPNPNWIYFVVATWSSFEEAASGSATVQWWVDQAPVSGTISVPDISLANTAHFGFDRSTLSNGNHVFYARVLEGSAVPLGNYKMMAQDIWIGTNTGPQDFIAAPTNGNFIYLYNPSTPEVIHYNGVPNPPIIARPYTYTFRPSLAGAVPTTGGIGECIADPHVINTGGDEMYSRGPMWGSDDGTNLFLNAGPTHHGVTTEIAWNNTLQDLCLDGDRFNNQTLAYSMFRDLEDGTGWIGIDYSGRLFTYGHGGAVKTLVGPHLNPAHFGFPSTGISGGTITPTDYATRILPRAIVEGTLTGGITLQSGNDLVVDPRNKKIIYVACQVQCYIARVDTSVVPAVATIYAGIPGTVGYVDGPAGSAQFDNCSSIDMLANGTLLICDFYNCAIRAVSPDGTTVSTVAGGTIGPTPPTEEQVQSDGGASSPTGTVALTSTAICFPYWGRLTSTETLVIVESFTGIHREINFAAHTVRRINTTGGFPIMQGHDAAWISLDVNKTGTVGPVDWIWTAAIQLATGSTPEAGVYRMALDGTQVSEFASVSTSSPIYSLGSWARMGKGYNNWTVAIHRTENRMIFNWLDFAAQVLFSWDPFVETFEQNQVNFHRGWYTHKNGSCADFPWGSPYRPSFCILYGDNGVSRLGLSTNYNSFEDLVTEFPDDTSLGTFIQGGMIGNVPRPELTGNHLRDLIYWIRRGAYDSNYPVAVLPGPNHPDSWNYPLILTLTFTRIDSSTVRADWTTDKPTVGFAGGCSATQFAAFGELRNHALVSAITPTYSTSGTGTIHNAPFAPLHCIIVVKDVAGNITYSRDQAVA